MDILIRSSSRILTYGQVDCHTVSMISRLGTSFHLEVPLMIGLLGLLSLGFGTITCGLHDIVWAPTRCVAVHAPAKTGCATPVGWASTLGAKAAQPSKTRFAIHTDRSCTKPMITRA